MIGKKVPTFRRNVVRRLQGSKVQVFLFNNWALMMEAESFYERRQLVTKRHGVISQKAWIFNLYSLLILLKVRIMHGELSWNTVCNLKTQWLLVTIKSFNYCTLRDVSSQFLFTNGCVIIYKGRLSNALLKKIKLSSLMLRITWEIICFAGI